MNIQNASDRNSAQIIARNPDMHRVSNQQAAAAALAANRPSSKLVPYALLLPVIMPQLDKDRAMQLQGHYARLRNNSISREEFVRHMRILVGDHMLKMAFYNLQHHCQVPVEHNAQSASSSLESDARTLPADQRPRLLERQSDSHGVQSSHVSNANVSAINQQGQKQPQKQQQQQQQLQQPQQHMNFPHSSFPTYGDPMLNMAVYKLQIRTDASRHYHHHHHHHHHHLMDPSQIIARNLDNELQRTHIMNSNQQGANATNRPSGVTFATLLQFLEPQLDKDRKVQLQGLCARLMNNSINMEEFFRHMRTLVGDYTLKTTIYKIQQGPDSR